MKALPGGCGAAHARWPGPPERCAAHRNRKGAPRPRGVCSGSLERPWWHAQQVGRIDDVHATRNLSAPFPCLSSSLTRGKEACWKKPASESAMGHRKNGRGCCLPGGEVAVNSARVDARGIRGNSKGEGTILGAVLVLDKDGEVLFHHKERTWGDHPSDAELLEAIGMLSPKSQVQRRSKI